MKLVFVIFLKISTVALMTAGCPIAATLLTEQIDCMLQKY